MDSYWNTVFEKTLENTSRANVWRRIESLNLIASENVMSPLAELVYLSDFMSRYAEGKPKKRYYQGTVYIDELEILLSEVMGKLLSTEFVEPRPVSGTIANAAVFKILGNPGDKALIAPVQAGSHVSHTKFGTLGALGMTQIYMPYDEENMNVDVDGAIKVMEREKPKFLVLGGSAYIFPHPVKELGEAAKSMDIKLVYDAAHVLGLIVGHQWQNPLEKGADIVTASTHKTFPGPQGGLIAFKEKDDYKKVSKTIFPYFISNHHLHRIPATLITAVEMAIYGEEYATQIVRNAKALAEALAEEGFDVLGEHLGYTRSHQVLVDVTKVGGGDKSAKLLEKANIIVNKNLLPKDPPEKVGDPSGIRLGVQEMTRYGMKESEMKEIAYYIRRVLIDRKEPSEIKKEVIEFRKAFTKVKYALEPRKEYSGLNMVNLLGS